MYDFLKFVLILRLGIFNHQIRNVQFFFKQTVDLYVYAIKNMFITNYRMYKEIGASMTAVWVRRKRKNSSNAVVQAYSS